MKIKDSFHTYAIIAIVFWSLAYVFTRLALAHFSAFALGFLRYFIASGVLVMIVIAAKMKLPEKNDLKWFALGGASGFFLYMITFNTGCETVTAATSSVIIAASPIISALLGSFVYKEKLYPFQWLAIIICFGGVVVLTLLDGIFTINTGIIYLLAAAILLSFYNLLQRKLTQKYSGLQTAAFSIFAGTIMLAIFLPDALPQAKTAPPSQLFYVGVMGVFSSALAYLAWSEAFAKTESISAVSNYMFVTPFLTTLLGFLIAQELPDLPTIIGGITIVLGLLIFNFGAKLNFCLPAKK
ncbi:MAG: DMT family transporter [Sporomusaceae bacterium]|nr:DMT family transporter [Sporomusaceae bacterium]